MKFLMCFSRNKFPFNVLALAIRYFQPRSKASHTAMLDEMTGLVYDVSFSGFRVFTLMEYKKKYYILNAFKLDCDLINSKVRKYHGVKYSTLQLFGNLCNIVFKKVNPFKDGNKGLVCNEFCLSLMIDHNLVTRDKLGDIEDYDLDMTYEFLENYKNPIE